eukprot:jgi/Tetstr1/447280/TSEL_034717.t1
MFDTCIIDHTIKIPAKHVGKNLMDVIEIRARSDLEGKCGPQGYIRPGSTKILHHGKGELVDIDFGKSYMFTLKLKCEICNPLRGLRFKAIVQAHNKVGVLAEGGFFDNFGNLVPVLEVVVIKDTVMLQNEIPTEELEVGDEVNIEVLGRVYELHDTRIRAFGRTVKSLDDRSDFTVDQNDIARNVASPGSGAAADKDVDDDASVADIIADDGEDEDTIPEENVEDDGLSDIDAEDDDDAGGEDDDPATSDVSR